MGRVEFTPGTYTYTVNPGWRAVVTIKVWGGGGSGGFGGSSDAARGGGGAGGYASIGTTLLPGDYTFTVGAGGILTSTVELRSGGTSSFTTIVAATGGSPGNATSGSGGIGGSGTTGTVKYDGGAGASISTGGKAGGGGGGASTGSSNGQNAIQQTGNSAGVGGGTGLYLGGSGGSNSISASGNGLAPTGTYGAGGGGKGDRAATSGSGAAGRVEISIDQAQPLPVTFGAIKASEKGTGVQIDWTSYSELNLANYKIERSADGINFSAIGEVAPRNAADATNYNFFDALPLSGTSFYRIRNNDIDGKSGLSNIVKINLNKNIKTIGIYPNPVIGNRVSFQTSDLAKGTYNVEVINAIGTRVFQQAVNHASGAINQSLNLPTLQSGQYTLRINGTSSTSTHKITILQ